MVRPNGRVGDRMGQFVSEYTTVLAAPKDDVVTGRKGVRRYGCRGLRCSRPGVNLNVAKAHPNSRFEERSLRRRERDAGQSACPRGWSRRPARGRRGRRARAFRPLLVGAGRFTKKSFRHLFGNDLVRIAWTRDRTGRKGEGDRWVGCRARSGGGTGSSGANMLTAGAATTKGALERSYALGKWPRSTSRSNHAGSAGARPRSKPVVKAAGTPRRPARSRLGTIGSLLISQRPHAQARPQTGGANRCRLRRCARAG